MKREELIEEIQHRKPQTIRCDRILVPTDGSGQAFRAVNEAIQIAAMTGAHLTVLMVVDLNKHVAAFEQVSLSGYVPAELKIAVYQFLADLMHVVPPEIKAIVVEKPGLNVAGGAIGIGEITSIPTAPAIADAR